MSSCLHNAFYAFDCQEFSRIACKERPLGSIDSHPPAFFEQLVVDLMIAMDFEPGQSCSSVALLCDVQYSMPLHREAVFL